ncbi:spore germination protein [Gracilibacillus boraciitolerans JCM 21714]|uniref:Spore germination protein n=1 Tax=Gracilibacillus boraciitolerans JCM 21714 TaxID=1298598 RepID=W4VGW6_9BACI|nr:spore germination protein [Gracilibacillus boraciitolerans JCM 21714]
MKQFDYADGHISDKQIMVAVPSFIIGIGVISLPQKVASVTMAADGWISLLIGGIITIIITWSVAKLSSSFPNQSFLTFSSLIVTKPVAILLTFLFAAISLNITALEIRDIADISKHYLLRETPIEVISLTFFLIIIYAVANSRVGLFRLNALFLPFVLVIAIIVIVFNIKWFNIGHLLPAFETSISGYVEGVKQSVLSYAGFGILWFYIALVRKPEKTAQLAVFGLSIPIVLYLLLYITCILVFGNSATSNLHYSTVELAKTVIIPGGGILERFESIFLLFGSWQFLIQQQWH